MNLLDCLAPIVALLVGLMEDVAKQRRYSAKAFAATLERCIRDVHAQAGALRITADDFTEGLFAVTAWADEALRRLDWCEGQQWPSQFLQRRLFGLSDAGIEFFERLRRLEHGRPAVREVYLACLALGFRGRYAFDCDMHAITATRQIQQRILDADDPPCDAAPAQPRPASRARGAARRWVWWYGPLLVLLAWAVLVNRLLVHGAWI